MREDNSPSFFNPEELFIVVDYVKKLLEFNVDEDDIGIITPYRKQVQKLKWRLEERGMTDITVGTTEEFQGQERKVIIVSTVRYDAFLGGQPKVVKFQLFNEGFPDANTLFFFWTDLVRSTSRWTTDIGSDSSPTPRDSTWPSPGPRRFSSLLATPTSCIR